MALYSSARSLIPVPWRVIVAPMDTIGRVSRQEPIRVVLVVFIGSNPFPPSRYPKKTLGHEMLDVRHRFVTPPVKMMPQGGGRGRTGGGGGGVGGGTSAGTNV